MGKLKNIIFILIILTGIKSYSSPPDTLWTRTFGGTYDDYLGAVLQDDDGGYIIAGSACLISDLPDVYLIKTDSLGDTLWTRIHGNELSEEAIDMQHTKDGGYIIVGETTPVGMAYNILLLKVDSLGDSLWASSFGHEFDYNFGRSVQQTSDGGYIIAGSKWNGSNSALIKTDSKGDSLWGRSYGGSFESVQQTTDGGYIACGVKGEEGVFLVKTDSIGDTLWTKTYGRYSDEFGECVRQTPYGGYIVVAGTISNGTGNDDLWLISLDSVGDTLWTRTYGGDSIDDWGESVRCTSDGGYIVIGKTESYGDFQDDIWLIKTDSLGDSLWTTTYGGDDNERGESVQQTVDEGYIIGACTYSYGAGNADFYVIKTGQGGGVEVEIISSTLPTSEPDPNPFLNKTTLKYKLLKNTDINISIYNMLGQKVRNLYSGKQSPGVHHITWSGTNEEGEKLPGGIYFLKIKAGGNEANRKLILMR